MTTAKTFAPILAVLAALPAADALCAPDRAGIQTRWLAGQIESARTTDNAAVGTAGIRARRPQRARPHARAAAR